jgi:hypothetical protein
VGDIYMTKEMGRHLVKLLIIGMVCFLTLIGYVLWQSYEGRADLVTSSRTACERGKLDRGANARGWRTAQVAREKSLAQAMHISDQAVAKLVKADPSPNDPADLVAARRYNRIANGLERRFHIDCKRVFPSASFLP